MDDAQAALDELLRQARERWGHALPAAELEAFMADIRPTVRRLAPTVGERKAAVLLETWKAGPSDLTAFLLGLTDTDIEAVSRMACNDRHPLQADALALLRALYATD